MLRLASFMAMLTAGFRKQDQCSLWISDHDETLATFERREQFARLACYLTFGCAGWKSPADAEFCTTDTPGAPPWVEDIAAIPDLIAAAACKLNSVLPTTVGRETWTRVVSGSAAKDHRAQVIGDWMATTGGPLRHILLRLEVDDSGVPRASAQSFVGYRVGNIRWCFQAGR